MPLSDDELDEIEARANAATLGPWVRGNLKAECRCGRDKHIYADCLHVAVGWEVGGAAIFQYRDMSDAPEFYSASKELKVIAGMLDYDCGGIAEDVDAEFIAHARVDIPRLIAELRAAHKALDAC